MAGTARNATKQNNKPGTSFVSQHHGLLLACGIGINHLYLSQLFIIIIIESTWCSLEESVMEDGGEAPSKAGIIGRLTDRLESTIDMRSFRGYGITLHILRTQMLGDLNRTGLFSSRYLLGFPVSICDMYKVVPLVVAIPTCTSNLFCVAETRN